MLYLYLDEIGLGKENKYKAGMNILFIEHKASCENK